MKKILTTMAVAAVVLTAACGCGKKWDGVTFESEALKGVTIVAPEEGWEVNADDETHFSIAKDGEFMTYGIEDTDNDYEMPKTEEDLKKSLNPFKSEEFKELINDNLDVVDFEYTEGENGEESIEYLIKTTNEYTVVRTTVSGGETVNITAKTNKDDETRVEQFRNAVDAIGQVSE